jgi:hypothetical protein
VGVNSPWPSFIPIFNEISSLCEWQCSDDETLPNFIKRRHPRNGEKNKQRARTKVQASKQPKEVGQLEERESVRTKPSTNPMKHIN